MTPTKCWDGVSYMIEMPLDEARPQVDDWAHHMVMSKVDVCAYFLCLSLSLGGTLSLILFSSHLPPCPQPKMRALVVMHSLCSRVIRNCELVFSCLLKWNSTRATAPVLVRELFGLVQ